MAKTKEQPKTGLYVGIVVVIVVVAVIIGVIVANNGSNGGEGGASQTESGLVAADLANVDVAVEYGDYDAMQTLAKSIQNGEMVGKVVKINGLVSHPGTIYSIVEENESGSQKIGTQFVISDAAEAEYPVDGAHVVLIGKIVQKDPMVYVIQTLNDFIEVK